MSAKIKFVQPISILRQLLADHIWCYKITFVLDCVHVNDFFRAKHQFLYQRTCSSGIQATFFCKGIIN